MAHTTDVTGLETVKADKAVTCVSRVGYTMHQADPDVTPTLDIFGSVTVEPQHGTATGVTTDGSSALIVIHIEAGGGMAVHSREGVATGIVASSPVQFTN